jgi:hypothetical protein
MIILHEDGNPISPAFVSCLNDNVMIIVGMMAHREIDRQQKYALGVLKMRLKLTLKVMNKEGGHSLFRAFRYSTFITSYHILTIDPLVPNGME